MPRRTTSTLVAVAAVLLAVASQFPPLSVLYKAVWILYGTGRITRSISDFPAYDCRRLYHEHLQACEDMWLSEGTRTLFLACGDPLARQQWLPVGLNFNHTGRSRKDAIVALDIDSLDSSPTSSLPVRALGIPGFQGTAGDGLLHGFSLAGVETTDGKDRLLVVNFRPLIDVTTGKILPVSDHQIKGGNTTIELFEVQSDNTITHVRSFAHSLIATPNRPAWASAAAAVSNGLDGGVSFYISNDRGFNKVGLAAELSMWMATGNIVFCSTASADAPLDCKVVSEKWALPNGLITTAEGQLYVPSTSTGIITVYQPQVDGSLQQIDKVDVGHILDNLSQDAHGDIWIASPGIEITEQGNDPLGVNPPAAVLRMRRTDNKWTVERIIEDQDGAVLPGVTTVEHDAETGRLFMSGAYSPFITVCEPTHKS